MSKDSVSLSLLLVNRCQCVRSSKTERVGVTTALIVLCARLYPKLVQ